jgi:hypothetical protein
MRIKVDSYKKLQEFIDNIPRNQVWIAARDAVYFQVYGDLKTVLYDEIEIKMNPEEDRVNNEIWKIVQEYIYKNKKDRIARKIKRIGLTHG